MYTIFEHKSDHNFGHGAPKTKLYMILNMDFGGNHIYKKNTY